MAQVKRLDVNRMIHYSEYPPLMKDLKKEAKAVTGGFKTKKIARIADGITGLPRNIIILHSYNIGLCRHEYRVMFNMNGSDIDTSSMGEFYTINDIRASSQ